MCGIFGAIAPMGQRIDNGNIRALAIANKARGNDGLGFFDSSGKMAKTKREALSGLNNNRVRDFLAHRQRWFLAGHTRAATWGSVSTKNAHPFRYGGVVGCHNGCVGAPKKYNVDSEYLFDLLDKSGGDYQNALANVSGYWALTWFNGDAFYMQAHSNSFALAVGDDGVWYYSSEEKHLSAATGLRSVHTVSDGETLRFRPGRGDYELLPTFQSAAPSRYQLLTDYFDKREAEKAKARVSVKATTTTSASNLHRDLSTVPTLETWGTKDDYDYLAQEFGYRDIRDVMRTEHMSLSEAKDYLDVEYDSLQRDSWNNYATQYDSDGIDN